MKKKLKLESTIKCPKCGFEKQELMSTDSCQYFYKCTNCGEVLKAQGEDCCVFCSYGTVKCPSIQERENGQSPKSWYGYFAAIPALLASALPVVSCPLCWPAYAALLSSLGLSFVNYTPYLIIALVILLGISLYSMIRQIRRYNLGYGSLIMGATGAFLIVLSKVFVACGLIVTLFGSALFLSGFIWNTIAARKARSVSEKSCNKCVSKES